MKAITKLLLVEQALDLQWEACLFHTSSVGETSLFTDHHCGRDQIPSQTVQVRASIYLVFSVHD